ncbi:MULTISPECIES: DUF6461 domain-containing protein [unclassified Streptomyces]|uniref:DUF6461 domain-containing protein n=1 Tax=unclassified Streptomyces TaxID=2593676 RepID=UPI002E146629|nr:DUF6461 domain-containing protein [Streptomyces sp. NBC_01197]WSS51697.1 DUF6461 domain-containing protein [Streptomyces sp. NBC_01180]
MVDLDDRYGEGWCVTLARRPVTETLALMGVEPGRQGDVDALDGEGTEAGPPARLTARALPGGWSLVVETSGMTGWVGTRSEVLEALSADGGATCSLTANLGQDEVLYAEDGRMLIWFEPVTASLAGEGADRFRGPLERAGFMPDADGRLDAALEPLPGSQLLMIAVEVVAGLRLTAEAFDGPWRGGVSEL